MTTQDYMFPPAQKEISLANGTVYEPTLSVYKNGEALKKWPWLNSSTINDNNNLYSVYGYYASNPQQLERKTDIEEINIYRYRFNSYYLKPNAKIFKISSDPCSQNSWQIQGTSTYITAQPGDVWDNGTQVYIFVSQTDINEGMYVDIVETNGGWKTAVMWDLRTYSEAQTGPVWRYFMKITPYGRILDGTTISNTTYSSLYGIIPEFSV